MNKIVGLFFAVAFLLVAIPIVHAEGAPGSSNSVVVVPCYVETTKGFTQDVHKVSTREQLSDADRVLSDQFITLVEAKLAAAGLPADRADSCLLLTKSLPQEKVAVVIFFSSRTMLGMNYIAVETSVWPKLLNITGWREHLNGIKGIGPEAAADASVGHIAEKMKAVIKERQTLTAVAQ